jgi:hypothetical protein
LGITNLRIGPSECTQASASATGGEDADPHVIATTRSITANPTPCVRRRPQSLAAAMVSNSRHPADCIGRGTLDTKIEYCALLSREQSDALASHRRMRR